MSQATPRQDSIAEYIAEHDCSVRAAAKALGIDYSSAKGAWRIICRKLGPQAS